MGFPYHELIAPAILLDHPGLTKDQLANHYQNTPHYDGLSEYKSTDPWDVVLPREYLKSDELAETLYLEYSQAYEDFQIPTKDSNGLLLMAPNLITHLSESYSNNISDFKLKYNVIKHIKNNLGSSEIVEVKLCKDIEEGEITDLETENSYDPPEYFIEEVIEKTIIENENYDQEDQGEEEIEPTYKYKLKVREYTSDDETEVFNSEEELFEKWPQFKPENMYNWSQSKGDFKALFGGENFLWKNTNGRFYLDEETFNRIPAGFSNRRNYGYTDLILTREAIRHQAWKLLSRRGLDHLSDFLRDFPDSKAEYEKAIWDSHTSLWAKGKEMNHFELIRSRLLPPDLDEENTL